MSLVQTETVLLGLLALVVYLRTCSIVTTYLYIWDESGSDRDCSTWNLSFLYWYLSGLVQWLLHNYIYGMSLFQIVTVLI